MYVKFIVTCINIKAIIYILYVFKIGNKLYIYIKEGMVDAPIRVRVSLYGFPMKQ